MKRKFLAVFLCIMVLCSTMFSLMLSAENNDSVTDVQNIIDGIFSFKTAKSGTTSIQEWIDGELTRDAGISSEWYILSLSQYASYDFTSYASSLEKYLSNVGVVSMATRQKYALCLITSGSNNAYISEVCETTIGKQGIMSLIYGLHILNNGYTSSQMSVDTCVQSLLNLQKEDGGWALSGNYGDTDVTAMTLQALAPHASSSNELTNSIERAILFISSHQKENGGFMSYGVENPESAAQVLLALSSLNIDFAKDERFIKNGCTILDAINDYRLSDGSFCHDLTKGFNDTATVQVLYSMISYLRMKNGNSPFYVLDTKNPGTVLPYDKTDSTESTTISSSMDETTANETNQNTVLTPDNTLAQKKTNYKAIVISVVFVVAMATSIILFSVGKRNKKNFIFVIIIAILLIVVTLLTEFQSKDDFYNGIHVEKKDAIGTVTILIRCDNAIGVVDKDYVPQTGTILKPTDFKINKNETVFDILVEAARTYGIQMEYSGSEKLAYIAGINYLYEFDGGDLSGWIYKVNGVAPSVGCGEYVLQDGDLIEWHYTLNLGDDVK